MRSTVKLVAVFMVLLLGVPAVACIVPGPETSEQECCKAMADRCGETGMDSGHPCRARILHDDDQFVQTGQRRIDALSLALLAFDSETASLPAAQSLPPDLPTAPPESPPHSIAVLRI